MYEPPTPDHAAAERRRPLLPPHVAWPLFVVLLLALSVGAAVVTVVAAHADGGVQIVEGSPYDPHRHAAGR